MKAWSMQHVEREERELSEQTLHRLCSKLARVETIKGLAVVTASIAFELKQSLCGIVTNTNACLRMLAADPPRFEPAWETLRRAIRDSNRALEAVTRFETLFGREAASTESVDLNEAAREVLALLWSELEDSGVTVRIELARDLPLVVGDRLALQQAILNLARNALDAMRTVNDRPRELLVRSELDGHHAVRLTLTDTGIGLIHDDLHKLFQPLYATDTAELRIGLPVCRSIIEDHHGRLWASANVGPGASFSFSLPSRLVP